MSQNSPKGLRPKKGIGRTAQLAAQLAPLEELNKQAAEGQSRLGIVNGGANQEVGAIVIDNSPAALSADITDVRRGKTIAGMEPVVIVILCFMLAFIAYIAWQISILPIEE